MTPFYHQIEAQRLKVAHLAKEITRSEISHIFMYQLQQEKW